MAETDVSPEARLIEELKNALVQRDLRIGHLELMLSRALVSPDGTLSPEMERSLLPLPPPPASHPLSHHISAETKGLYPDGWTAPSARLVLHPGAQSGHYTVSFWLPADAEVKPLSVTDSMGVATQIDLIPGRNVIVPVEVPADGLSPATLQIETEKLEPKGADRRELGVVVSRVVWVEVGNEG